MRLLPLLLVGATACGTSWAQSSTPAKPPQPTSHPAAQGSTPASPDSPTPVGQVLSATSQPASGQPASGQPASGQPASGQPASGQPAASPPASGPEVLGYRLPPLTSVRLRNTREAADRSRVGEITVKVNSFPKGARIYYGRKLLGATPLTLKAKRGSTPLDVVIKASGFMTLHTRLRRKVDRTYFFKLSPAKIR